MESMFDNYENLTDKYPDNRHKKLHHCIIKDTIIRGTTPTHYFVLPFDFDGNVNKLFITYKQGLGIVLEKTENDIQVEENEEGKCVVSFTMTQDETLLFEETGANNKVKVQLKCSVTDTVGKTSVIVSDEYLMDVKNSLHEEVIPDAN